MIIQTNRLILRPWGKTDFEPFALMNGDPRVMEHFPSTLNPQESDAVAQRISTRLLEQGWGLWAVSVPGIADFIGFIGLDKPTFQAHFTPTVEVGWRLAYEYWGRGYAIEGAEAALQFAFENLKLPEVVSFTVSKNQRSTSVMTKIGMTRNPADDFEHPNLPPGHPLRPHVLYRITCGQWQKRKTNGELCNIPLEL